MSAPTVEIDLTQFDQTYPAISDYGFISNCGSAALIGRDGAVEWCCFHRFDSRPVFARMLDRSKGGYFRIAPVERAKGSHRYLPDTNVLETRFETSTGVLTVTDCLPFEPDSDEPRRPRRAKTPDQLIRRVRCEEGSVEVRLEFLPRFDYGLTAPIVYRLEEDVALALGGADALFLETELGPLTRMHLSGLVAQTTLKAGEERFVSVRWAEAASISRHRTPTAELRRLLERTIAFWQGWCSSCTYVGPHRDAVVRSALALKGLTSAATGAVVAAPTTSLPESIGGVRNWDYRYTWLRDSMAVLASFVEMGHREEAIDFGFWLHRTAAAQPRDLQIMYALGGERFLHEVELPHLEGYRGSRPVRIGNGAWNQFQLDTYGEILSTAWFYRRAHFPRLSEDFNPSVLRFLRDVCEAIVTRWMEPDEGAWEIRTKRRHFVFSKLMAWLGVDRCIRLFQGIGETKLLGRWSVVRDAIREAIETRGVDPRTGAFVQAFDSTQADASALQLILKGFVAPDDPRALATIQLIREQLCVNGHVYRYLNDDGLPGNEGAFTYCSLWLSACFALTGQVDQAEEHLEQILACRNDLGLLSEEYDPDSGEQLGNFPQAFSHVGIIEAAFALQRAAAVRGARFLEPAPSLASGFASVVTGSP